MTLSMLIKRVLLAVAALFGLAFVSILLLLAEESIRLHWWRDPAEIVLVELTSEQKAADMRYLLELTREASSAPAAWQAAGLENPLEDADGWVRRAAETPDNRAFADLILQYSVHLQQVGHGSLAFGQSFGVGDSLIANIPKEAYYLMPQWQPVIASLPWYAHSPAQIGYRDGHYVLLTDLHLSGDVLPAGTRIETVGGKPVQEFVLELQGRDFLRWDAARSQWVLIPLLRIDPGAGVNGWRVGYRLETGESGEIFLPKISGFISEREPIDLENSIRCVDLGDALYIHAAYFDYSRAEQDRAALRRCFEDFPRRARLVLDVRGNDGGEIWSYMDNLIAPLIRHPVEYTVTAAVAQGFYRRLGWREPLYHWLNTNELSDARTHLVSARPVQHPGLDPREWRILEISRRIEPAAEPYAFEGSIVLLADSTTISAGDSFTAAMRAAGLAVVGGDHTNGMGAVWQAKTVYALPNSGIMFYLDSELTLNPDGSVNQAFGTPPDFLLNPSTYPTPYPVRFDRESLLADPWVRWAIETRR